MKINGNEIKVGNVIVDKERKDRLWLAIDVEHVKPGKGGAYAQVELKCIQDGTKLYERFRSTESVEKAEIFEYEYQFLYFEQDQLVLMDRENFDQISIPKTLLGDDVLFLKENMEIRLAKYENLIVNVIMPETAICEVVEADAVVKGQTASSSQKPCVLNNGIKINLPQYIEIGTRVVVNIKDRRFISKAE